MFAGNVQFANGEIMEEQEIRELVEAIISKFSEEGLSYEKAKFILKETEAAIESNSFVRPLNKLAKKEYVRWTKAN